MAKLFMIYHTSKSQQNGLPSREAALFSPLNYKTQRTAKSARHPRSTQMPPRSYPHVSPSLQGDPLRCLISRTPLLMATRQKFLPMSLDSHRMTPFDGPDHPLSGGLVSGGLLSPGYGGTPGPPPPWNTSALTRKSARQPRSTQMPRRSYPQVSPSMQGDPLR
jgi:hypothetical protein